MEIVADESVDYAIIDSLRQKGIIVYSILENFSGITDQEVLKIAHEKNCLIITEDKDFGELAYRLKLNPQGILLIRLTEIPRQERIKTVTEIIGIHFVELENNFSVLTKRGLRIKNANLQRISK